jgi:hypothetical protein
MLLAPLPTAAGTQRVESAVCAADIGAATRSAAAAPRVRGERAGGRSLALRGRVASRAGLLRLLRPVLLRGDASRADTRKRQHSTQDAHAFVFFPGAQLYRAGSARVQRPARVTRRAAKQPVTQARAWSAALKM